MNNELNIVGLKHGGLAGAIAAVFSLFLIMLGREYYLAASGVGTLAIALFVLVRFGRQERDTNHDGYLSYLAAFVYASILFFISGYIAEAIHITICNYFDPQIKKMMLTDGLKSSEEAFRMLGLSEKEIDDNLDELEISLKKSFSYYSLISNSWALLVRGMFFGAIGAFFIKKSKPDFSESND